MGGSVTLSGQLAAADRLLSSQTFSLSNAQAVEWSHWRLHTVVVAAAVSIIL